MVRGRSCGAAGARGGAAEEGAEEAAGAGLFVHCAGAFAWLVTGLGRRGIAGD